MLQNIGDVLKGQRWLAFLILGLLILVFALWGTAGVVDLTFGTPKYGLKVNGEEIPSTQLQQEWQERQSQYLQQFKTDIPPEVRAQLQNSLLDQKIRETLMRQRAAELGLRVGDEALMTAYRNQSAFQVDGTFSEEAAKAVLAQNGMTPAGYEERLRKELQIGQLERSLQIGDFLTPSELQRAFALENEQRELRYALLPVAPFAAAVKVDDARAKAWYDAHADDYLSKESVRLQYAELRLDTVAAAVTVNPSELEAWYKQNQARYLEPEKRHARHILIIPEVDNDAGWEGARIKADMLRTQILQGADFIEMAKQHSRDATAKDGGDLGTLKRGELAQDVETAILVLKVEEVSQPFRSPLGYHVFKLEAKDSLDGDGLVRIRQQVRDILFRQKYDTRLEVWIKEIRQRAIIEVRL
jgi:peptidyl-prolyl cis-trans isomerase D